MSAPTSTVGAVNKAQIEAIVNDHVNHVVAGGKIEDEFVEAKAVWPEPDKAGQLGGMANAAHGHPIMWIVGVDEKEHRVVPLDETDPANWWPQMQKQFAYDVTPDLQVVNVSTDHGKVVCLRFETDRAPYFVKKPPRTDKSTEDKSGWITAAAPWRSGTRTRTATRAELLSLLQRSANVPTLQLVNARIAVVEAKRQGREKSLPTTYGINISGRLFLDSQVGQHLVLPWQRRSVTLRTSSGEIIAEPAVSFYPISQQMRASAARQNSGLVASGGSDVNPYGVTSQPVGLIVLGPDLIRLHGHGSLQVGEEDIVKILKAEWMEIDIRFPIGTTQQVARVVQRLQVAPSQEGRAATVWALTDEDAKATAF